MHFTTLLLIFSAAASANPVVPKSPEITPAPMAKPRDVFGSLSSDIGDVGSDIAGAASSAVDALSTAGGDIAGEVSSEIAYITSEAGPLSSSLAAELSTISTGAVASSLHSALSSLDASVSSATGALATFAPNATTTAGPTTSSSKAGGSPAQTVFVGIGSLMGGMAMWANM